MEKLEQNKTESWENIERKIINIALDSGKIKREEIYDLQLGIVESYSGEGIVELNGERYKVIGYPLVTNEEGRPIKKGWVQVYKMREWQE